MRIQLLLRWRAAAIILIILASIYVVFTPLNIWLGNVAAHRGEQQVARVLYSGAVWNAVVAALCLASWSFMKDRGKRSLLIGACCIALALFIVMRVWISGLLHGRNPFPVLEAFLTWLPMLYVLLYGVSEAKRKDVG